MLFYELGISSCNVIEIHGLTTIYNHLGDSYISPYVNLTSRKLDLKFYFSPQIELNIRKLKKLTKFQNSSFSDVQFNLTLCGLNLT